MGFFALLLLLQAGALLLQPGAVVALPGDTAAAVEFQNPFGGVVKEVAIMGNGHHGAGEALQEHFQPFDGFSVQVVGGFVKQKHVGLGQQQLAQRHAALFTTGQQADLGVPRGQAQCVGGDFNLVLRVGAGSGDHGFELALFCSECVEVGIFFGVGRVDFLQALFGVVDFAHGFVNGVAHGVLGVQLGLLLQVADAQARHGDGLALDLLVHAGHDLQQGGFARTVQAEHADLGAGEEGQRDVFQDLPLGRHGLGDAVHGVNVLGH